MSELVENRVITDQVATPAQRRRIDYARLDAARKNRNLQLQSWEEYDKSMQSIEGSNHGRKSTSRGNHVNFPPNYVLLEAALRDDVEEAEFLLNQGMDPNVAKDDGLTPLHQACINDSLEMCSLLIKHGADINCLDSDLWTPLHAAATGGHVEICELLLDNGADILALNIDGHLPLDLAEDDDVRDFLLDAQEYQHISDEQLVNAKYRPQKLMRDELLDMYTNKEPVDELDAQGAAPIHVAAANGYDDIIKLLFRMDVNPDALDADGWTPSHVAAYWGQLNALKLLVAFGADFTILTPDDQSVFSLCDGETLRLQVLKLWDERDSYRSHSKEFSYKPLPRRRSTTSVRRSSMRDKTNISKREVMKEVEYGEQKNEFIENGSVDENSPTDADSTGTLKKIVWDLPPKEILKTDPVDQPDTPSSTNNEKSLTNSPNKARDRIIRIRPPTGYDTTFENESNTSTASTPMSDKTRTTTSSVTTSTSTTLSTPTVQPSPRPGSLNDPNKLDGDVTPKYSPFKRASNMSVTDTRRNSIDRKVHSDQPSSLYDPSTKPRIDSQIHSGNERSGWKSAFENCCSCCL